MKHFVIPFLLIALSFSAFAQSKKTDIEVLYFKAQLACCQARSCNKIEGDVKDMIDKMYPNANVKYKVVQMESEANKALVQKYKARAMSLVIVNNSKKKETFVDASDIVRQYYRSGDKAKLEKDLKEKINLAAR